MTRLFLIGGGGHCKAAIDVIEADNRFIIGGIFERALAQRGDVLGYPVIGTDRDLPNFVATYTAMLVTIGQIKSPDSRRNAFNAAIQSGASLPVITSPRAYVSRHATVGDGTLVMHGAVVNAAATVGQNCILNSLSLVEHGARIGDHCHIATGARVNGDVTVKEGCFIGSGAILKNGITIGKDSVIGAGCVIQHDLPDATLIKHTPVRQAQ